MATAMREMLNWMAVSNHGIRTEGFAGC